MIFDPPGRAAPCGRWLCTRARPAKHDAPDAVRTVRSTKRANRARAKEFARRSRCRVAWSGPAPGTRVPRVSKPALISNRRVITIALELELARVWRGYLVFFSLGAC
jgi:hypothetical protein